jgi:nickel transport protein
MPLALWPVPACAHGSSVFESADSSKGHAEHHGATKAHGERPADAVPEKLEELHDEIDHLAEQLSAHDERIRITDIIGGIGYIVGITGAVYYYLGARRRRQS